MLVVVIPATAGLLGALRGLGPSLRAADQLMYVSSPHWSDSIMPLVLFAFYGLVVGAGLAAILSLRTGLSGPGVWLSAGVGIAVVIAIAALAAPALFPSAVPRTCWVALACVAVAAAGAIWLVTAWLG